MAGIALSMNIERSNQMRTLHLLLVFSLLIFSVDEVAAQPEIERSQQHAEVMVYVAELAGRAEWDQIDTVDIYESTEGGQILRYWLGGTVGRLAVTHLGETGQSTTEYFSRDGELCYVQRETLGYNRPIYWDSTAMRENGDDQVFDIDRASRKFFRIWIVDGCIAERHELSNCVDAAMWDDGDRQEGEVSEMQELFIRYRDMPADENMDGGE